MQIFNQKKWLISSVFILILTFSFKNETEQVVYTPEWSKGAVWYQIFPERFRNGNPANDPTEKEVMPDNEVGWQLTPWTSGWYNSQPWEKKVGSTVYDGIYQRRYGGDLEGVIEKLDYLADLGVTAIYFNPIFEAHSLHKYDASSYHHIDNNFGRDRDGDRRLMEEEEKKSSHQWQWSSADSVFLELISEAHKRNIRIVIDGVFNHVGRDFWAFKDVLKNGEQSLYKDWFDIKEWDDPNTDINEFDYSGWWGHKSLPEFYEDENSVRAGVKEHIWHITRRWMDPNGDGDPSDGVDGWRLDAVPDLSRVFWREWCTFTRTINPDIYLTAEVWAEAQDYMGNEMFNSVMNYPFAKVAVKFFIDQKYRITPVEFGDKLNQLVKIYQWDITLSVMTLINSHDTDRLANMILNPDRSYDHNSTPKDSAAYDVRKPSAEQKKIQIMIAAFQATFPGAPLIYYGDEAGMWGADDPDDRKPMLWDDLIYEDEDYTNLAKDYPADKVAFDRDLFNIYKKLFSARKYSKALKLGDFKVELANNEKDLFGYSRTFEDETVYVYFNRSPEQQLIKIKADYKDLLGKKIENNELTLAAKSVAVLIN